MQTFFFFFKTGTHYVALAGLELVCWLWTHRTPPASRALSTEIKGDSHHAFSVFYILLIFGCVCAVCVHVYLNPHGSQGSTLIIFLSCSPPYCLRQVPKRTCSWLIWLDWLASKLQGSSCFHPELSRLNAGGGITDIYCSAQLYVCAVNPNPSPHASLTITSLSELLSLFVFIRTVFLPVFQASLGFSM